ncbi:GNAT family N-acetyltransferase [Salibacterium halotolerans]|uniref:N-acetyltransferase domain-containing protein n=1 Tax=Salibacterium halotolerans TaxID=1884432 RepID=A0A1I5N948_9BACI|nr:N-acetyltransferase [Salibacterium halotolerans]SFP18152.1 hypothetical protein SAMN05518683_10339 [Salibacterium halotolerans]
MQQTFLKHEYFKNINLQDPFFDSLKDNYEGFERWFLKKRDEKAYFHENEEGIQAFLYLKVEDEELINIYPPQPRKKRIKIGTLKINPHGTKLGERFLKKAIDHAVVGDIKELYVTIFPKHTELITLLEKYGFRVEAKKTTSDGVENVMVKRLDEATGDLLADYPLVNLHRKNIHLLGILPKYHTLLFPDSILTNESFDLIKDTSHTNSIHKVYICYMKDAKYIKSGDIIVIYRTNDYQGPAEYRSVATSICVVESQKSKQDFKDYDEYYEFCKKHSVFSDEELNSLYKRDDMIAIKMTYNLAMERKLIRKTLIEDCGVPREGYWGIKRLTEDKFENIVKLGGIHESFIIDQA